MKTLRLRFVVTLPLAVLFIGTSSPALGLANRVFVSARSGNNANSCDNINTPCQTFAGAVLQLNSGGEAIVLDSGGYGPVTITQSVTIEAPPGVLAFIHPPTPVDAVTVNASGATVVLRGLTIDGAGQTSGSGMNVVAVGALHVESCVITGFAGLSPNGSGIYFASAGQLFVKDTIIRKNGGAGVYFVPSGSAQASVDHCRLEQNAWGLLSNASGSPGTASVTIRDSVASGNTYVGLYAFIGGELNAEGCLVANNGNGLATNGTGSILRASSCTVTDNNTFGLSASVGSLVSRSNNTVRGNGTNGSFTGTFAAD